MKVHKPNTESNISQNHNNIKQKNKIQPQQYYQANLTSQKQ